MFGFLKRLFRREPVDPIAKAYAEQYASIYAAGCHRREPVSHHFPTQSPKPGTLCQCGERRYVGQSQPSVPA